MTKTDDVKKLPEEGHRRASEIVAAQDAATLEDWRRQIEIGWQQAERGELVDGPSALAALKARIKSLNRSEPDGEDA